MKWNLREIGIPMWVFVIILWAILGYVGWVAEAVTSGMIVGQLVTAIILSILVAVWTKRKENLLSYTAIVLIILALGTLFQGLIDMVRGWIPF